MPPLLTAYPPFIPRRWNNQHLKLYHGTTLTTAQNIVYNNVPISVSYGSIMSDFGQGFYTSTLFTQAATWAWQKAQLSSQGQPAVIELKVSRNKLGRLISMWFIRGGFHVEDYWSFVFHCRNGNQFHRRNLNRCYDVVAGPVAAFWTQRLAILDVDQISFHTLNAEQLLNSSTKTLRSC